MKIIVSLVIFGIILLSSLTTNSSFAHQSGCHRWHTCPSDSGSYTYTPKSTTKSEQKSTDRETSKIPESRKDCRSGQVCFVNGDYIKYQTYEEGKLFWEKIYTYKGTFNANRIAIGKTDVSYDPQVCMVINKKCENTVETLDEFDRRVGLKSQEAIGSACCYDYFVLRPSPVSIDAWLKNSSNPDYWKDKASESTHNYNGTKRDVIIISEGNIKQVIDKQTGILILIQTNLKTPDGVEERVTKLVDTNIIQASKNKQKETQKEQPITNSETKIKKTTQCLGTALCISGKVKKITDGDTLVVDTHTIRLSLTNTPESDQNGFKEASAFTKKICPIGSNAIVDQDDKQPTDKYQRKVGKVICSGKILNAELLYNGHANILTTYCSKSEFSSESWAQKYGCGNESNPIPSEQKMELPKQSVYTDKSSYEVSRYENTIVTISGKVENYKTGIPIIVIITKPNGSSEELNIVATDLGFFTTMMILDKNSQMGDYSIKITYNNSEIGTSSFKVKPET